MSSLGGFGGGATYGDKGLRMSLTETMRLAWADPELRQRIIFVLAMFAIYALGINISIPIRGFTADELMTELMNKIPFFSLMDMFGGGALRRLSILALGLNPYITASIVMQILTTAFPQWKKELQEGGQYARQQQSKRTKALTLVLCVAQGWGLLAMIKSAVALDVFTTVAIIAFWTAGSMFMLWLGEQITEKGIGNGVSLMIFAGIVISLPGQGHKIYEGLMNGLIGWWQVALLLIAFFAVTWFIVMFTIAQRRIPVQHMRRQVGTKMVGGQASYLPFSLNMAGVIPIIFAVSLVYLPQQFGAMFPAGSPMSDFMITLGDYLHPGPKMPQGIIGGVVYCLLILFFTYFYTAIQYNVDDIADNLKRYGSFIPGVRPGKQTRDFLDGIISRITLVGAGFLAVIALTQSVAPMATGVQMAGYFFGTSLLIMVSVALESMRQIEANLMMKQYGQ